MGKRIQKVIILIFVMTLLFFQNNLVNVNALTNVYDIGAVAKGMCVLEGNTNVVLYGKNLDVKLPMASTTKIITAIVTLENIDSLDEEVNIADESVGIEGTSIYLRKDEVLTVNDLLYGLMLASGNDASVALACHVGGTQEKFVDMMNNFVVKIGATNTHLDNPHGLDSATHYTTAKDLALITSYALKNDDFRKIVSTKYMKIKAHPESGERYLRNKNKLLFSQEGNIGVKTGFTDNAGRCLVNAVDKDDMMIVSVVLNCGPMFQECKRLTNMAFNEFKMKEFVTPYNYIGSVPVENGEKNDANVVSIKGFKIPIKIKDEMNYNVEYTLPDVLQAPVKIDDVIGDIKVYNNDELIYSDKLYSIDEIKNINIKYMLNNIIEKWF